jgi:hypothetical protein
MDAPQVTIAREWFGDVGPVVFYAAVTLMMAVLVRVVVNAYRRLETGRVLINHYSLSVVILLRKITNPNMYDFLLSDSSLTTPIPDFFSVAPEAADHLNRSIDFF